MRLFPKFFQLRLERHHLARDDRVIRLRANGVDLAVHFLREKIQRAADRFPGLAAIRELLEMALQPRQFLRNVAAVGEQHDLLQQPLVIRRDVFKARALDAVQQLPPVGMFWPAVVVLAAMSGRGR